MTFETELSGGIAEVTMNHPPVNAFEPNQLLELAALLDGLSADRSVRVVILRSGSRGFCAGIDIKGLAEDPGAISAINRAAFDAFRAIHQCRAPVISAVHGYALGAGLAMVGASDIVFAAEGTKFGLPEINVGMLGGASHALRLLPLQKVRRMYYTGEPIVADEMYRLGAVEQVVPRETLDDTVREVARTIAGKGPRGLEFAKQAMNAIEPVDLEKNYRHEQGFTFEISHLAEGLESRNAFREGRPPHYEET
jgi:enoyl-CoA hydratase